MVNGIRTSNPRRLNKECGLKLCVGSRFRRKTPEESRRSYRPKRNEYNNKDGDSNPKTLNGKNHQALSQKFRKLSLLVCLFLKNFVQSFFINISNSVDHTKIYTQNQTQTFQPMRVAQSFIFHVSRIYQTLFERN